MRSLLAWVLVTPWAAWALVRVFGLERGYPLIPLVAFTPYAAAAAGLTLLAAMALRRWVPAAVAAVTVTALVAAVGPRALADARPATGRAGPTLRVLTANLAYGRVPAAALVELVRREEVDVLSLQELTPEMVEDLEAAGLREELPGSVLAAARGAAGTGLYARFPLRRVAGPAGTRFTLAAAAARVPRAPALRLVAVHPVAPAWPSALPAWRRDLRALPAARKSGPVRILAGDFNATLDHRELRRLLATGYEDAAAEAGAGLRATWPSGRRLPPGVAIDHVLADGRCRVREVSVHALPGSDHRGVLAELVLPRG